MDGLPSEFYKAYSDLLAPHLLAVYAEALEVGTLPPTLKEAVVLMFLKPADRPDFYRPLSLLNLATKILAKVIANRLKLLLRNLVLPDQAGFVPTCS